jgi:hypothetical protein
VTAHTSGSTSSSSTTTSTGPRIPAYDYAAPTEANAVAALQRVWGAERGSQIWLKACRDAGLQPGRVDTLARLESVNASLATQGGATATVARSIEIRMRTYTRLAARAATTGGGSAR